MKKLFGVIILHFFVVGLFAQAAQMSYTMLPSEGIRGFDKSLQQYKINNNFVNINDAELIDKVNTYTLSFVYNNKLYVLAYDDFDEIPLKTRGIYLFRKDFDGWHVASDRIFTATYVNEKLIDEYIINPRNTNVITEVLENDMVVMLIRNRIWVTDTDSDLGQSGSYMVYLVLYPVVEGCFDYYLLRPRDKFDFFPEGSTYNVEKSEDSLKISSGDNYIKFMFSGGRLWEAEPNILIRLH